MTGLTEDDLSRLIDGLRLTQNMVSSEATPTAPTEQMLRIIAVLRDESDTRMLIESAKADIVSARSQLVEAKAEIESLIRMFNAAAEIIALAKVRRAIIV